MSKRIVISLFIIIGAAILITAIILAAISRNMEIVLYFYKPEIKESLEEICAAFSARYPGISIETIMVPDESYGYLKSLMVSGNAPDIIQLQSYNQVFEFSQAGYLLDLSNEPVISFIPKEWLPAVSWKKKIYGMPMDFSGIGIFYNKEIFAKYKLTPPATYPELKRVCGILKSYGIHPFAGMLKANWSAGHFLTLLHTTQVKSNSAIREWIKNMDLCKASWADPVNTDMLFNIMDFYKLNLDPRAPAMTWHEQQAAFAHGEAAMMVQGLWIYSPLLTTNPHIDCGFIPFPLTSNPEDTKFYADVDSVFALSASAGKNRQEAAKKFLDWLSSEEAIALWTKKCRLISVFTGTGLSTLGPPFHDLMEHTRKNGYYEWEFCRYPASVYNDYVKNSARAYLLGIAGRADVIAALDNAWRKERKCYGNQ
ncbi:MAG: extracellular solute-binding protein [Spirochaetales bacterium]|nr:extracellular solute-binding protein [Spirochaetales bacterium]